MQRLLVLLFLFVFSVASHAQEEEAVRSTPSWVSNAQKEYVSFLSSKGITAEIDKDGDVKFTYNDKSYFITIDRKDQNFFRLMRVANLKITDEAKKAQVYRICHDLTQDLKVTKVYWYNSMLWASTELLVNGPNDFKGIFDRAIKYTQEGYDKFVKEWQAIK